MAIKEEDIIRLIDIRDSIREIMGYTEYSNQTEFARQEQVQEAVFAQLAQIGGAASLLTDEFKDNHGDFDWDVLKGLQYGGMDHYLELDTHAIWHFVYEDLPGFGDRLADLITVYQDDEDIKGYSLNREDERDLRDRYRRRFVAVDRRDEYDTRIRDNTKGR